MFNLAHDLHLVINLLIKDTILHETSLLKFLCGVGYSVEFGCDLVYNGEGALANYTDLVVLWTTSPFSDQSARDGRRVRSSDYIREQVDLGLIS